MSRTRTLRERFLSKTQRLPNGCLLWTGATASSRNCDNRYGRLRVGGRMVYAHRIAYELATGLPFPAGKEIDHTCRNTLCVAALHLEAVTHSENELRKFAAHRSEATS